MICSNQQSYLQNRKGPRRKRNLVQPINFTDKETEHRTERFAQDQVLNLVPTPINWGGFLDQCVEKDAKAESEPNGSLD